MAARTVKTPAEVLEAITPVAPVVAEPVTPEPTEVQPEAIPTAPVVADATPEVKAEPVVATAADLGKPTWVFQINHIQNITFPDNSEYKATFGTHAITDPVLARKLLAYATQPGTKRQIFLLSSPN